MGQLQNQLFQSQPYSSPGSGRGYSQKGNFDDPRYQQPQVPRGSGYYSGMPPYEAGGGQGISREPVPPQPPMQRGIDQMPGRSPIQGGVRQQPEMSSPLPPPPGTGGIKAPQPQMSAPMPPPQPGQGTPYAGPGPVRQDGPVKTDTKSPTQPGMGAPAGQGQPMPAEIGATPASTGQAGGGNTASQPLTQMSMAPGRGRRNPYRGWSPPEYAR